MRIRKSYIAACILTLVLLIAIPVLYLVTQNKQGEEWNFARGIFFPAHQQTATQQPIIVARQPGGGPPSYPNKTPLPPLLTPTPARMTPTPVPTTTLQPTAGGKALYVAPGGNDGNDGSQGAPFATISRAAAMATPGSVVHVLPGTYNEAIDVTTSGSARARITFVSDTSWGAKIRTTDTQVPWTTHASYIDIIGFDVASTGSRTGINNLGSYIRTIGNHVHDVPSQCDSTGGAGINDGNYSAHDDDIIGNVVNNIGSTYPTLCQYVHGIYHSTLRGHVQNNITYDNAGCGINLWHAADATIVTNNLSFDNEEHGISIGTDTSNTEGTSGDNFIVANNISINNALLGIRERRGVGSHDQYLNNIVYGNGDRPFGDESYAWPSAAGNIDEHTITQSAQFVNFQSDGSGDYHVLAASPAIDAGVDLDAPATDFAGTPRPQGQGIDIGPYEYMPH